MYETKNTNLFATAWILFGQDGVWHLLHFICGLTVKHVGFVRKLQKRKHYLYSQYEGKLKPWALLLCPSGKI